MASTVTRQQDSRSEFDHPDDTTKWTLLAEKYWLRHTKSSKVNAQAVKSEIWDVLQSNGFQYRSLLNLENLQLLEKLISERIFKSRCADSP